jgi:hypothetical protein
VHPINLPDKRNCLLQVLQCMASSRIHLERTKHEIYEHSRQQHTPPDQLHSPIDVAFTTTDAEVDDCLGVSLDDPHTYIQAMNAYDAPQWNEGYDNEIWSLHHHGAWTLVPHSSIPKGRHVIGSWAIFLRKRDEHQ